MDIDEDYNPDQEGELPQKSQFQDLKYARKVLKERFQLDAQNLEAQASIREMKK